MVDGVELTADLKRLVEVRREVGVVSSTSTSSRT